MSDDAMIERVARAIYESKDNSSGWQNTFNATRVLYRGYARAALSALPPRDELLREALEALTKTPLIEAITPTSKEWRTCETVQDTYDLMKHRIRAAADKIRAALTQEKQT